MFFKNPTEVAEAELPYPAKSIIQIYGVDPNIAG